MLYANFFFMLLGSAGLIEGAALGSSSRNIKVLSARQESQCLVSNVLQTASTITGQEPGTAGILPGQALSKTDNSNFINFCENQVLTNGSQNIQGSCNPVPMGKIPALSNMVSAIIISPGPGDLLLSGNAFNVSVQTAHLNAGHFVNPTTNYYSAPQDLDENGDIIGHCHVTIQSLGSSLSALTPPDPSQFAFFKGIDDAGNGQGLLQAVVDGGLQPGFYRVCTLIAAQNHQPVTMPQAKRGAQDDCNKFEVVASTGTSTGSGTSSSSSSGTSSSPATSASSPSSGSIVKVISGTLGGAPPPITSSGDPSRPFEVNGNTFPDAGSAVQRACDIQNNKCCDAVNGGQLPGKSISDCQTQRSGCAEAT